MKKIKVPIHSFVDTITNSSTVIYVQPHENTIEMAKELINTILKMACMDKTADELFRFSIIPGDEYTFLEMYTEEICNNIAQEFPDEFAKMMKEAKASNALFSENELEEKVIEKLTEAMSEQIEKKADEKYKEVCMGSNEDHKKYKDTY